MCFYSWKDNDMLTDDKNYNFDNTRVLTSMTKMVIIALMTVVVTMKKNLSEKMIMIVTDCDNND